MFFKEYVYGDKIGCNAKEKLLTSKDPEKTLVYPDKTADTFFDNYSSVMILSDSNVEVFIITHDGHTYQGTYGGYFMDEGEYCIKVGDVVHTFNKIIFLGVL